LDRIPFDYDPASHQGTSSIGKESSQYDSVVDGWMDEPQPELTLGFTLVTHVVKKGLVGSSVV
jgi:hypothetical protein